jgi:methionine-rich copper-binding protein CopC
MRKLIFAALSVALILSHTESANAHAQLTSSVPRKNQTIKMLPNLVWLEFDGELITLDGKAVNELTVTNSKKVRVDIGGSIVGGARISTKLKPGLTSGKYMVSYRIVSEDGHPVDGSFSFTYKPK